MNSPFRYLRMTLEISFPIRIVAGLRRITRDHGRPCIPTIPVKRYWTNRLATIRDDANSGENSVQRRVLSECIGFQPTMTTNTLDLSKIVQSLDARSYADVVIADGTDIWNRKLARLYGVRRTYWLHHPAFPALAFGFIQTVYWLFAGRLSLSRRNIIVGDHHFGALVYDEYLRWANRATVSSLTCGLFLFAVRSAGYYWLHRFLKIRVGRITDLVISHSVYAKVGTMALLWSDARTNIWLRFQAKPFAGSVRRQRWPIPKHFYFDGFEGRVISFAAESTMLDSEYLRIRDKRLQGAVLDKDSQFVFPSSDASQTSSRLYGPNDRPKRVIVVMAHALVDAVYYPRWRLFKDNYCWLVDTLEFLLEHLKGREDQEVGVWVRPHPAESLYPTNITSRDIASRFAAKSNLISVIEGACSQTQLIEAADVIITSHGSVGVEATAEGVPVITAADSMYAVLGITENPKDLKDYFAMLIDAADGEIESPSDHKIRLARAAYIHRYDRWLIDLPFKVHQLSQNASPSIAEMEQTLQHIDRGYRAALSNGHYRLGISNLVELLSNGRGNLLSQVIR